MLKVEKINCCYGKVRVLNEVSLNVDAGEFVVLIGANGAGKTTTLRTISGLLSPVSGRITFEGTDITGASVRRVLEMGIAHCPEGRHVFPYMTVQENLEMGCYLRRDRHKMASDIESVFDRFPELSRRRTQTAGTLSGGEQQMLAIGRALMSRPKLVLFDEPSLGLAPNNVQKAFEYIQEINRNGTTVLMVEQDAHAALDMCSRSFLMESGRVTREGRGREMADDPHVQQAYLGVGG